MRPRRAFSIAGAAALLAVAAFAVATAPDDDGITATFPVHGTIGETVTSRELSVKVNSVELATRLDVVYHDASNTTTDGVWVVVDTTITSRLGDLLMSYVELQVGDVTYRVSDILSAPSIINLPYGAGIPVHGTLVFEVPKSAITASRADHATIAFNYRIDPLLDTIPVVTVDLTSLDVEQSARIEEPYVADSE